MTANRDDLIECDHDPKVCAPNDAAGQSQSILPHANVNLEGIPFGSDTPSAAPVTDRSRTVHAILSPPYSIRPGLLTR